MRITATDVLAPAGTLYGMEIGTWFGFRWVRHTLFDRSGRAKRRYRRKRLAWSGWGRKSARRKRRVR